LVTLLLFTRLYTPPSGARLYLRPRFEPVAVSELWAVERGSGWARQSAVALTFALLALPLEQKNPVTHSWDGVVSLESVSRADVCYPLERNPGVKPRVRCWFTTLVRCSQSCRCYPRAFSGHCPLTVVLELCPGVSVLPPALIRPGRPGN